ncbi:MAG: gamma-glutamylcyclotransferase [Rhodobacteraceae bacterium]|nr:gamma-glutamylcyclotransferase [Paracoccaceae bacterium]
MFENGFWVFGYGSLVWQPEFTFQAREIARLDGFSRSFCMRSIHHRGSVANPGLVLALDRDRQAHCDGVAFFVGPEVSVATIAGLRERELISSAYLEQIHEIHLRSGKKVDAVCYVIDENHNQYCGGLPLAEQAAIIAHAIGGRGPNTEYLYNTASHLRQLGIKDNELDELERLVRSITST